MSGAGHDSTQSSGKHRLLREVFGFEAFRPGQEAIIDDLAEGRHVLAVMPTGSGKSLCFQIPALLTDGLAIVVSPLVALMQDQVAALKLAGVRAETINSARSREDNVGSWRRVAKGEVKLLYLAPERLMTERMLAALSKLPVRLIAIDEAHCISQWGPSFRPEYEALSGLRGAFPGIPIGAFTATADEITRRDIAEKLFGGEARMFVHGFDRPNIRLAVEPKRDTTRQLFAFLDRHQGESGIVYCLTRKRTEKLAAILSGRGYRALAYHAGMEKREREENQNIFMSEKAVVMAATIAFGMGIDKPDVRFVCHADLPGSVEAYYQEIGRAGRDGLPAEALLLFGLEDMRMRRSFIEEEDAGEERRRREHKRLDALISYCEAPECRRVALLGYFGESSGPCGNCDVCLDPAAAIDGTLEAQKILSAVHRTGERYGAQHIADVLRGEVTEKAMAAGHDRLPTFGIGKERSRQEWLSLIRQLTAAGFLRLDIAGYGGLAVAARGRALLKGEEGFRYRPNSLRLSRREKRKREVATLPEAANGLLERLKALRLKLARERSVPAYVIFSDRSLIDMAAKAPRSLSDFADVHGVGEAKLKEFAGLFLAEIARA